MGKISKGLFVTATGTDDGKTYVTALIVKKLREMGINAGYYKAALSGADSVEESDAGYVNTVANIGEPLDMLVPYIYKNALSPHLAAQIEGDPVEMSVVKKGFERVKGAYDYVTMEGSGGIMCPIRYDDKEKIFLEDIIKEFKLPTIIVTEPKLGSINTTVLTVEYLKNRDIPISGIVLNNWTGGVMQEDNAKMMQELTSVPVCAYVKIGDKDIDIDEKMLLSLYKEI